LNCAHERTQPAGFRELIIIDPRDKITPGVFDRAVSGACDVPPGLGAIDHIDPAPGSEFGYHVISGKLLVVVSDHD
jgi:hypothetical protein